VEPALAVLWQGEQDYRLPMPGDTEAGTILTGLVERTVRGAARMAWDIGTVGYVWVDAGVDHVTNASHTDGRTRTLFVVTGGVTMRLSLSGPFDLGF